MIQQGPSQSGPNRLVSPPNAGQARRVRTWLWAGPAFGAIVLATALAAAFITVDSGTDLDGYAQLTMEPSSDVTQSDHAAPRTFRPAA